jgi:hypothetical protein
VGQFYLAKVGQNSWPLTFWKKLKKIADVVEIIENPNQTGFGIGVLRVPAEGAPDLH